MVQGQDSNVNQPSAEGAPAEGVRAKGAGRAPEPGQRAKRDWTDIRNRAGGVVAPWLGLVIVAYFIALNVPAPGLPGPLAWFLSAMESNPFRACHVEVAPPLSEAPSVKKSSLFIRESHAQESVPDPSEFQKGEVPNAANQQVQQQAPIFNTETLPQFPLPLLPAGEAVDCEKQGFGDLIDVAMDRTGQRAWAINAHGLVYRTEDGGKSWRQQAFEPLEPEERLTNVAVSENGQALVIASQRANGGHRFFRSDDGGATWAFEPSLEPGAIVGANGAVGGAMAGPIIGMTIGDQASHILVMTGMADQTPWVWRSDAPSWRNGFEQIEPPMLKGWRTHNFGVPDILLGANGSTALPMLAWSQPFMTELNLIRLDADPKDPDGALVQTYVGSFDLSRQVGLAPAFAAAASESGTEIFLGGLGSIVRGAEDGDDWTFISVSALDTVKPYILSAIDVANDGRSIMATGDNALLISHDGGATFFEPPLGRAPAPWFYLVLLAGPAFVLLRLKQPAGAVITVKGDKSNALSDRAQGLGGPDALNLKAYAEGIFDLLRNAGTEPPLVIGVTGPWGSGKSSVMLKLADLLKRQQMPTVWFNAWHHQNEDHLLASMLSNIRGQGIPKFWSKPGFRLRWRLLMRRLSSPSPFGAFLWSWFLLLLAALLIPGGLLLWTAYSLNLVPALGDSTQPIDWSAAAEFVTAQFCDKDGPCGTLVKDIAALLPSGKLGAVIAFLISLLSLDRLGRVALITRGFDPAKLMASMLPSGRNPKLDDQLSFRHRFGEELRSTAKALSPYRLVIFIDDLDRCRPENVVAVLEAVNFVVSEAECYVVIGMDRLYVLRAIRQQFAKFIDMETAERKAGAASMLDADEGRPADFAEHYLEKLINMFVAVPKMNESARERLMEQMVAAEDQVVSAPPKVDWAGRLRRIAAALLIGFVVVAPTWYLINRESPPPPPGSEAGQQPPPQGEQQAAASGVAPGEAPVIEVPLITPRPEEVIPTRSAEVSLVDTAGLIGFIVIALVIAATVAVAVVRALAVPRDLLKHDTTAFRGELLNAEKSLASYLTTPRRAKRFVNRLRLFASVLKTMLPTMPSPSGGRTPVDEDLDRQIVVAGTLHTLGREALAAKPEEQASLRTRLAASMATIYQEASDKPMVDRLYWRFWGVSDGVKPGDPAVVALAPANILKPPADEPADGSLPPAEQAAE